MCLRLMMLALQGHHPAPLQLQHPASVRHCHAGACYYTFNESLTTVWGLWLFETWSELFFLFAKMGTFFKKEIFDEHVQQSLVGWAQKAKKRKALKNNGNGSIGAAESVSAHPSARLELMRRAVALEEGSAGANGSEASAAELQNRSL